jgi:hypothetical protein
VCGWRAAIPHDPPSGAPRTGELLAAARMVLAPEIDAAVSGLVRLPDTVQVSFNPANLPSCVGGRSQPRNIEIDNGDVLAFTAVLQALRAGLDILTAYNLDVDLRALVHHTAQDVLAHAPALLALTSAAPVGTARQSLDEALRNFGAAISSVLAETDDQSNDLLVIVPGDREDAQRIQHILDLVRRSLQAKCSCLPTLGRSRSGWI